MSIDPVEGHFGNWIAGAIWAVVFLLFLAFTPFYKKSQRKPASVYGAFVLALALEMFGVPLSMYVITWVLGKALPDGILWGHTLVQHIGLNGMYLIMYPILIGLYYRLAKREEEDMRAEFGAAYDAYRARTGMFLPRLFPGKSPTAAHS